MLGLGLLLEQLEKVGLLLREFLYGASLLLLRERQLPLPVTAGGELGTTTPLTDCTKVMMGRMGRGGGIMITPIHLFLHHYSVIILLAL